MKSIVAAIAVVLLMASSASARWAYVAPAPVVHTSYYWAGPPVYAYPAPTVVARPIYAAPPVYVAPAPVVYPAPYVVRARVLMPGQPVRNVLRVALP